MPRMDGMEVLTHMHNDAVLSRIPVIIISNSGQAVEIEKALALGAKDYLVKAEFDPREVLDKNESVVACNGKRAGTPPLKRAERKSRYSESFRFSRAPC